jgi:BirA family biotin operon repressor/biotin-[acetyl-CoA-carboxylase] ligase
MSEEILSFLKNRDRGNFVSGEEISTALGITRAAVWKKIKGLQQLGYRIEAVPSKGYTLVSSPDIPTKEEVQSVFSGDRIGTEIIFYRETTSTNDKAMEMAAKARDGTVVIADAQVSGRGRLGRKWISPPGKNLYFTVILKPSCSPKETSLLTLMAAVAVVWGIRDYTGIPAVIKWPNDIFLKDRKVGGILTEMKADMDRVEYVVVGIGVNVNMALNVLPRSIRSYSTSLSREKKQPVNRTRLLGEMLAHLDHWYKRILEGDKIALLEQWRNLDVTVGKEVDVKLHDRVISGIAEGISSDGELMVKCSTGAVERVYAGDVTMVRKAKK